MPFDVYLSWHFVISDSVAVDKETPFKSTTTTHIVLLYTTPWPNINNLTKYCDFENIVLWLYMDKDSVTELFLSFVLLFF